MDWLKNNRIFPSNRAIAEKMGYNPSVVSQVITGKSNVSERFVRSLCTVYPALSYDWIWEGHGTMILDSPRREKEVAEPIPQLDRFSFILADMAEIIKNMTVLTGPLAARVDSLEKKLEERTREIEKLRTELDSIKKAATSRKK